MKKAWTLTFSIVPVAAVIAAIIFFDPLGEFKESLQNGWQMLTSAEQPELQEWIVSLGMWGPLVLVVLMVLQMFLLVVPSWLLMLAAVLIYGPIWGGALAIIAVLIASAFGYLVGVSAGYPLLRRIVGEETLGKVCRETDRYGLWAVLIARLNPLLSNDAISFVGGVVNLGFARFLLATFVGITPLTLAMAIMGQDWQAMKWGLLILSLLSLAGLVLKIGVDKHRGVES